MKFKDNGAFYSVTVSRDEVSEFKSRWPGSGLPDKSFWFQFDKRNDDLIDFSPTDADGGDCAALMEDAKEFAKQFLK